MRNSKTKRIDFVLKLFSIFTFIQALPRTVTKTYHSLIFIIFLIPMEESKDKLQILQANNQFAADLYQTLCEHEGNICFSPLSVHVSLSMTYQGAQGTTAERFASVLHAPDTQITSKGYNAIMKSLSDVEDATLLLANRIFLSENCQLLEDFNEVIKKKFLAEVQTVNFENTEAAAKTINDWVAEQTQEEILNLIDKKMLNFKTKLVIVNAVFFKGGWKDPFSEMLTATEPFYVNDNETVDVQMMHKYYSYFSYKYEDESLYSDIVQLPYSNEDLNLVIIVPYDKNGIQELEQSLATYDLSKITENVCGTRINLALPRFKIEKDIDLKEHLSKLGLEEIFDEHKANLAGIMDSAGTGNLYVNDIIQKALIEVDEEGSKATSATAQMTEMFISVPPEVVADHPFVFLLRLKECILFMGRVVFP